MTSPTLAAQIQDLLQAFPQARWHQWEPAGGAPPRRRRERAFGGPLETRYDFTKARRDSSPSTPTLLCRGPARVRYAREFAARRRVRADRRR